MTDQSEHEENRGGIRRVIEGGRKDVAPKDEAGDAGDAKQSDALFEVPAFLYPGGESDHRATRGKLPDECPVIPLGILGPTYHYLDEAGQLRDLGPKDHGRLPLQALFGRRLDLLFKWWPTTKQLDDSNALKITGWRAEEVGEALMVACAQKGLFDAFGRVRGTGAWRGDRGELVFHCGDQIISKTEAKLPGTIGPYVYPADAKKPRPASDARPGETEKAVQHLLGLLEQWNWRRPELDPFLFLGWLGAAMIGGALKWRPLIWITGDMATGKSTLHDIIKLVQDEALIAVSDTTAAGIWQKAKMSSLPVAIDELEAEADNRKVQSVITLAREAASGAVTLRGGNDHNGTEFRSQCCFLFSSILIPPLPPQDRSRMGILELNELTGTKAPVIDEAKLRRTGALMRHRLLEHWDEFENRLNLFQLAMAKAGHKGRGADVFGTLLAVADLLLSLEEPCEDVLDGWGEKCQADLLKETAENEADHQQCVAHLLTSSTELKRSGRSVTIGEMIVDLMGTSTTYADDAREILTAYGLKPIPAKGKATHIAVANEHRQLGKLFEDQRWANGVWRQAMARVPGSEAGQLRFTGKAIRCQKVPIGAFYEPNDAPAGGAAPERRGDHTSPHSDEF